MKVVIDTDPGTDDALALIMALGSPELDVVGLTTVGGNATLAHTTRNALQLLAYLGRPEVPLYRGASRPMKGRFHYGYDFHGSGGITTRLPPTTLRPQPKTAADYLIEAAGQYRGELILVALGPLTNVAQAIRREPRLADWINQVVIMGGAVEVPGNVTAHAEFNFYNDPVAAGIVLSSGIAVRLIGLDVTNRVYVSRSDLPWVRERPPHPSLLPHGEKGPDRSWAGLASRILASWFEFRPNDDRYHLHDPLAVAAAIQPSLLGFRPATATVETGDSDLRGKVSAVYGEGPVRVAVGIDAAAALSFMRQLIEA